MNPAYKKLAEFGANEGRDVPYAFQVSVLIPDNPVYEDFEEVVDAPPAPKAIPVVCTYTRADGSIGGL